MGPLINRYKKLIIGLFVVIVAILFILLKIQPKASDVNLVCEIISAFGAVLVPFAIVYIEKRTEFTRIEIEQDNSKAISEMKIILEENRKILDSIQEFESTYGEDIKALAKLRQSGVKLMSGQLKGNTLRINDVTL